MADITATFVANFQPFSQAVRDAELELRSFEDSTTNVGASLERMADRFSGRKLIEDATLMMEAVERIGGATKLTEVEFAKLAQTVGEATAKMRAMQIPVPANMDALVKNTGAVATNIGQIGTATTVAGGAVGKFGTQLGQVDRMLALVGLRVGPLGGAFRELGAIAGTTTTALGLFGTGLGVLLTGKVVYDFTRSIIDSTVGLKEWDTAIANNAAKWLGWGDVVGETAAYQADRLALASAHAGREITDLTEAERINKAAVEAMAEADAKAAEKKKELAAETAKAKAEFEREFEERVEERNRAFQKKREEAEKKALEDKKAADAEKARAEKAWRDYQNWLGERHMEDAAAQLKAETDAHKKAVDEWIAEETRKYEAYLTIVGGMEGTARGIGTYIGPGLPTGPALGGRGTVTYPTGPELNPYMPAAPPGYTGPTVQQTFNINGTGEEVARMVTDEISRTMRGARRWPTA